MSRKFLHSNKAAPNLAFLILAIFAITPVFAQTPNYGLQPGTQVPAFNLKDQDGNPQTLKSLAGPNGLLILFNRSADWCPFCKSQLIDLETARQAFEAKGIHVASVTYDSTAILRAFATRRNIHFEMLSDPDSAIIDAFGIRNHDPEAVGTKAGIAIPNYFLITPDGVISKRYAETQILDRTTAAYAYELFFGPGTARPTLAAVVPDTPHLAVSLGQSDNSAAPGNRIRLTVQLSLGKGSHLYAPGADAFGYRPIRITLDPSNLYQANPTVYEPAAYMEFPGLQESVPVFASSTVLTQDLWAIRSPKTNAHFTQDPDLTIHGTLEYQVCTDTTCFAPEKKPVSWKLHVVPSDLDMTRVAENLQRK
jgi:peroxiredoxin